MTSEEYLQTIKELEQKVSFAYRLRDECAADYARERARRQELEHERDEAVDQAESLMTAWRDKWGPKFDLTQTALQGWVNRYEKYVSDNNPPGEHPQIYFDSLEALKR